jgi:transposase
VRASTLLNKLLDLPGISVSGVSFPSGDASVMLVDVAVRARRMGCPSCDYTTKARYDTRPVQSSWRHLDFGHYRILIQARLSRLRCPVHGVIVQRVPFARHHTGFTRDFDDVTAFLTTRTDKTSICRFLRLDWDTIGRICERVVADDLDPQRLTGLVDIGVDEISWRTHHRYLTLVTDHRSRKIVWGRPGKDAATMDAFFTDMTTTAGPHAAERLETVSMDMGPAFAKSVTAHAPRAAIAIDPFHAVRLVGDALDVVRRQVWNELRAVDPDAARTFKGARWALMKRPDALTDDQAGTLRRLRRRGGDLWRAYSLKEAFRAIFAGDLDPATVMSLIDRWISKASRSRLTAFVKAAKTIRKFRDGIATAIRTGINNGRAEGLNAHVRLIIRRARGFHTADAALALVMLTCGPITIDLPYEKAKIRSG